MPLDRRALNQHAGRVLKTHRTLLNDEVRNRAFFAALKKSVNSDSCVLDIGAGTGVWAITAAELGARRVVAIEADEMLAGLIRKIVAEKGLAGKIDVICGFSINIDLPREFDIVVSETIGYIGYDEDIVPIMSDARSRFLLGGGTLIPENVALHACLGNFRSSRETVPAGIDTTLELFNRLDDSRPRVLKRSVDFEPLTGARCLIETDLRKEDYTPSLMNLKASWASDNLPDANAVCVWVESRIADDTVLDTRKTSSWFPNIYPLGGAMDGCDGIDISLGLSPENSEWTAVFHSNGSTVERTFSLASAADLMLAGNRINVALRVAGEEDIEFRKTLFATSRMPPLFSAGWDESTANTFLAGQFDLRERAYRAQFESMEISIIAINGVPGGGIIVNRSDDTIHLVDIEILPEHRKKGVATSLIESLTSEAAASNRPVSLQVAKDNLNAFRLYKNLGFEVIDDKSLHVEMIFRSSK